MKPLNPLPAVRRRPPRLALVIGSGGVRSAAALGVAEALHEGGFAPDLIVGCSSGAVFGTALAMGLRGEAALDRVRRVWSQEVTEQRRWKAIAQLVAPRLAGFDESFSLRDDRLFARRIVAACEGLRIEDLPVALRIAATEAASGNPVVIDRGPLADAVRASIAVPFIFPSVEFDGRRLVDGVVSDPLPLRAAADAQAVVAIGFRGAMPRRVDRASRLAAQATTALINNLMHARIGEARSAGRRVVCLELELDRRVGLWDTTAMPDMVEAGRRAALARWPQIAALAQDRPARAAA